MTDVILFAIGAAVMTVLIGILAWCIYGDNSSNFKNWKDFFK